MEVQGIPTWTGQGEVKPAKVPEEQQWVAGGGGHRGRKKTWTVWYHQGKEMVFLKEALSGITVLIRIIIILIS